MKSCARLLVSTLVLALLAVALCTVWLSENTFAGPVNDAAPPEWNPNPPATTRPLRAPEYKRPHLTSPVVSQVTLAPSDTVRIVLPLGECFKEVHVCSIPEIPPVADILLDFDLTGSMGEELTNLKANSIKIMTAIRKEVSDCNFGLISGEDFNAVYPYEENCGYPYTYGSFDDSEYRLDIPLTSDTSAVRSAIGDMFTGFGRDCPESYSTRFFEAVAELLGIPHPVYGPIGWRSEAKKIVLAFNDAVPHDCDWTACSGIPPSGDCVTTKTSGRDPGRDGLVNTADDLGVIETLKEMASLDVSLVDIYSGPPSLKPHWDCWTGLTPGGGAFQINENGSIPGGVSIDSFVVDIIKSTFDTVNVLAPEICSGDTFFVASVEPPSYENVPTPGEVAFEFEFCVPPEIELGTYCFDICYLADGGEIRRQTFCIDVIEPSTFLDIKPGSCPNPLNVKSQGVLPVAVLGRAGFDATSIDLSSVRLEGVSPIRSQMADVGTPFYKKEGGCECIEEGPDGFDDLTLKFRTQDIVAALGEVEDRDTVELFLTGSLDDGEAFEASDCMIVLHIEWRKFNPSGSDVQGMPCPARGLDRFGILGVLPNPTFGRTEIAYALPRSMADVDLRIYDLSGRLVRTLQIGTAATGECRAEWDGRDDAGSAAPTGIYMCVLKSKDRRDVTRLVLLR